MLLKLSEWRQGTLIIAPKDVNTNEKFSGFDSSQDLSITILASRGAGDIGGQQYHVLYQLSTLLD